MSWTLDAARKVWICTSYSDLNGYTINNLAEYGQPHSPYEHPGWVEEFDPDFANVVVEMPQSEVMANGYGRNITAKDFPYVKRFLEKDVSVSNGTYSFDDLVKLKAASDSSGKSDRWIRTHLYGWGPYAITAGALDPGDAAYVHGSVSFALMTSGTKFIKSDTLCRVEAEIGAGNDNWDFNSGTIPDVVNVTVGVLLGPDHYNLEKPIRIQFTGPGKQSVVERRFQVQKAGN
jgi:hypothetical protein